MNANELVDVFDTYAEPHDWGKQAVAMLRQQQVEIDTYKSQINSQIDTYRYKELTDEEIWDFINALCLDMGDYWELTEKNAIPMIRAILKKASEK
jgi:hypothetical protein